MKNINIMNGLVNFSAVALLFLHYSAKNLSLIKKISNYMVCF